MFSHLRKINLYDKIAVLAFFTVVFMGQSTLATIWASKNVFAQFNVIFDADPILWQEAFASG